MRQPLVPLLFLVTVGCAMTYEQPTTTAGNGLRGSAPWLANEAASQCRVRRRLASVA